MYKLFRFLVVILTVLLPIQVSFLPAAELQRSSASTVQEHYSPTKKFLESNSLSYINSVLNQYQMTERDKKLFINMINNENDSFIGYHAGSMSYFLFQDILKWVIQEKLNIPIREDFHFLRVPGIAALKYSSAADFITQEAVNVSPSGWDSRPEIRQHIFSLNPSLYQSYDAVWDFSPRYYLENQSWTHPSFILYLESFFVEIGLDPAEVTKIYELGKSLLPKNRGFIMQFFDPDFDYEFSLTHFYVAYSGGKPYNGMTPRELLYNLQINKQLRLVIDNKSILNPFGKLIAKRYDSMSASQRKNYGNTLSQYINQLPMDPTEQAKARERFLNMWSQNHIFKPF